MSRYIKANNELKDGEIEFEDEIFIEGKEINAYIKTSNINLEDKFNLKYKDDSYYDMYLNYNYAKDKVNIEIVFVSDSERKYYYYLPNSREKDVLIRNLERYIKEEYNQTIKKFIKEYEEEEEQEEV